MQAFSSKKTRRASEFVRACAVEIHLDMSKKQLMKELAGKKPESKWGTLINSSTRLNSYRKNPSVWTHCLGKKLHENTRPSISRGPTTWNYSIGHGPWESMDILGIFGWYMIPGKSGTREARKHQELWATVCHKPLVYVRLNI